MKMKSHSSHGQQDSNLGILAPEPVLTSSMLYCLLTSLVVAIALLPPSQWPLPASIIGFLTILGQSQLEELVQGEVSTPLVILKCLKA